MIEIYALFFVRQRQQHIEKPKVHLNTFCLEFYVCKDRWTSTNDKFSSKHLSEI